MKQSILLILSLAAAAIPSLTQAQTLPPTCLQGSASTWTNGTLTTQTAQFTVTYDATPGQANMDGVVGFSSNAATSFTSLAAIARFATTGMIDVRNGGAYSADVAMPYVAGSSYHFRLVIDPIAKRYNVYVTRPGQVEVALATNYAFRSEQASTSSLNNWAMIGTLTVCNMAVGSNSAPPVITTQPVGQTVTAGQTVNFSVTATGTAPLSYQWRKNGVNISGATSSSYTTPVTTTADSGAQFSVMISNSVGSVTSSAATLTVNAAAVAPAITTQPVSQTVTAGQTANFSVGATGTAPLSYQWRKNGVNISGATSSSYATPVTTTADSGAQFSVMISNSVGSVTSSAATLTVNAALSGPYTIWPSTAVPTTVDDGPDASVELGVTFRADTNGFVTGIRFYKGAGNTGTHVGNLWSNTGTLLATATFTAESASGWQQVNFSSPVAITANTEYVASYHASVGHYSASANYFATSGADRAPLHAPANGSSLNGRFAYGSSSVFPTGTFNSTNYWIDVVFSSSGSSPPVAPAITTQPVSQTIIAGQTANFSVTATGTAPMSYQWKKNGTNVSGATSSSYVTSAMTTADNGAQFAVVVSNSAGSATSSAATLTVNAAAVAPVITTQPVSQTVAAGQTANFSVGVTGTAPLSYQWRKAGVNISGATSSSYTTPVTTTADSGAQFSVVVSNSAGSVTSSAATLTVIAAVVAPVITTQPASQTVTAGQTASFSVGVTGTAPLSYQWRKAGVNISGAISSSYTTPVTTTADSGAQFSVVVSNSAGSATSSAATLTVNAAAVAPAITTQPIGQTGTAGQTVNFSVTATGTAPLSYQWRKNGVNISGATSSSYTTPVTTTADSGAQFSVMISNSVGSVTSSAATLTVNAAAVAPAITTQPVSQTVTAGQTANFSVGATGTAPLSYQWRKNGVNISGATSSSYATPVTTTADSGAQFSVMISNSVGSVTSSAATLTVNAALSGPYTIWPSTAVPTTVDDGPDASVELGVTFRADTNGFVTGIRFYKGAGNTGTHVGNLWSNTGTLLATATFTAESASGWQQVNFSSPVAITANTEYVASYHASVGHYSASANYFATSGADRAPLHAPANGSSLNGRFAYGSSSVFPTGTFNSTNYWIDVVFSSSGSSPPVAPAITTQPVSQTIIAGQTANFSVTATGTAPMSYQWKKNGTNVSGATSSSYVTSAMTTADNGAQFAVVVSNSAGSATSSAATLTVNAAAVAPVITTQPVSQTVAAGQTANFSVGVTGTAPLSYQWRKAGVNISGATSSSYTTPVTTTADSGAQFSVVVSNSAGSVTSASATLTVNAATRLLSANPTSLSFGNVSVGGNKLLSSTLTNSGNSSVTISAVSIAGAGFSVNGVSTGQMLLPGQTATLNVTFAPSVTGSVTGSAVVTSNASNSPRTISLSGTGVRYSADLAWIASTSTVVGYHVYSATVSGGPYTRLTTTPVAGHTYKDSTVLSGRTYYYVLTAINASGLESVYSSQVAAVIP